MLNARQSRREFLDSDAHLHIDVDPVNQQDYEDEPFYNGLLVLSVLLACGSEGDAGDTLRSGRQISRITR